MPLITYYAWEDNRRTLLRKILPGDLFIFDFSPRGYGFGRIMSRNDLGHVAEFFGPILNLPTLPSDLKFLRLGEPMILDSYILFDRKIEGDWRIVGHQSDYAPGFESVRFAYGSAASYKLVDIFDVEQEVSATQIEGFQKYAPHGDLEVKEMLERLY